MKTVMIVMLLILSSCSRNVEYVKSKAAETWKQAGYEIVGYEGYSIWSPIAGGEVWYTVKSPHTPGILYSGYLERWFDEIHVYGPRVINKFGIEESKD